MRKTLYALAMGGSLLVGTAQAQNVQDTQNKNIEFSDYMAPFIRRGYEIAPLDRDLDSFGMVGSTVALEANADGPETTFSMTSSVSSSQMNLLRQSVGLAEAIGSIFLISGSAWAVLSRRRNYTEVYLERARNFDF